VLAEVPDDALVPAPSLGLPTILFHLSPDGRDGVGCAAVRAAVIIVVLGSATVRGAEFEVTTTTIGQADQLRRLDALAGTPTAEKLDRRRLTQELDLRVFEILPPPEADSGDVVPRLQLVTTLRFDRDFGDYRDSELVPEVRNDQLDVLTLYLEGQDFARGMLDWRVGRQTLSDLLDLYAFDGADIVFHPPIHVAVEGFGGLMVRERMPLSSPTLELDGTSRSLYWDDEREALSPMFGGALMTHGLRAVQARASYRRTMSRADVETTCLFGPCADGVDRIALSGIDEEKVALTVRGAIAGAVHPWAGARYNVLTVRLDRAEAGVRVAPHADHALTPAWSRHVPDFDGDSIFNLYALHAYQDASLTWDVRIAPGLRGHARYLVRRFTNEASSAADGDAPAETSDLHHGAGAGARLDGTRGQVRLDGRYEGGYGGLVAGADLAALRRLAGETLTLEGRASALRFENDLRAEQLDRATWALSLVASARWQLASWAAPQLLLEENRSEVYPSYLRMLVLLDLGYPGAQ